MTERDHIKRLRAALQGDIAIPRDIHEWLLNALASSHELTALRDELVRDALGRMSANSLSARCQRLRYLVANQHSSVSDITELLRLGVPFPGERQLFRIAAKKDESRAS